MNFGFLARCDAAGATLHQFGEAPAGLDLLSHADADGWAVVLGRLYYLDDLRRRLDEEVRPAPQASPAEHVLAAYRHGGERALDGLEGDYAYAVWDARRRRLLAGRDPFGGFPLFWVRAGAAVVLATGMPPLLALLPGRTINRDYVADFLLLPGNAVPELNREHCAYEGVHRVLAGTRIEVRPDGAVRAVRWWDWLAHIESPPSLRPDDLAGRFRALLEEAVQQRRVGRTAAHLSGGMDSTAVALLAARQAHAAGDEPVHGLSVVFERFALLAAETPYIESALGEPGLVAHRLPGEDVLDFDAFRYDLTPDEPAVSLCLATTMHATVEHAAWVGARTLLTGLGGDEVACETPHRLHDLLRRGRWLAAWRESARWAQRHGTGRWSYLGLYGLRSLLPAALQGGLACWWRGGQLPWERQSQFTIAPFVRPGFAQRFRMWDRVCDRTRRAARHGPSLGLSMRLEMNDLNVGDAFRWEVGVPRGVMIAHPFRDVRFVCFCLGWQDRVLIDPGRQKPILADATRDVLPAVIRDRVHKGHFNEEVYAGLNRNLPVLEALVREAPADDLEVFDREEMLHCLRKTALGIDKESQGMARLCLGLALLKWLTGQKEAQRRPGPTLRRLDGGAGARAAGAAVSTGGSPPLPALA